MALKQATKVFQSKISEMDTNCVPLLRSGTRVGWLRERTWKFGIPRYTRRFVTVDFDTRMLYYCDCDSELGGNVTMSTPFCDILGVESCVKPTDVQCWTGILSCLPGVKEDQHGLVLRTKAKRMELRCTSASESQKWIATIQDAIIQDAMVAHLECASEAQSEVESAQSTRPCSRESTFMADEWMQNAIIQDAMVIHLERASEAQSVVESEQSTRQCSRESTFMAEEWEQVSEEHASDKDTERCDLDFAMELPLGKLPQSIVGQPGRKFSARRARITVGQPKMEKPQQPTPDSPCAGTQAV